MPSGDINPRPLTWYNKSRISYNWQNGIYKGQVLLQHSTNYMPWLIYHNSETLLMSVGSELQCYSTDKKGLPYCKSARWKLQVPKIKRPGVRTNDISRFILKNSLIVCGNRDGCMAVYKVNNVRQKPHLLYHIRDCHDDGEVELSTVELISENEPFRIIATGSNYSPILRIWHLKEDNHTIDNIYNNNDVVCNVSDIILPNNVGIRCMQFNYVKNTLTTGFNGNDKPALIEPSSGKILMAPQETIDRRKLIRDIQWHNVNTISYVTHHGKLRLIDIRSGDVVYDVIDPFLSTLYCLKTDGDHSVVVGSSEYARCVLFDTRQSKSHVQLYFTQRRTSPVYSLDFDNTKLIAAADRSVAVVDFNVSAANVERRDYSSF
ncbi:F-box/WD repeat-containing protein 4 [Aphomia sociella]